MNNKDALYLFTQLPCITCEGNEDNFVVCAEDDGGYIPTLYHYDGDWLVDWLGVENDSIKDFHGSNPESAICAAFTWCVENKLISIN